MLLGDSRFSGEDWEGKSCCVADGFGALSVLTGAYLSEIGVAYLVGLGCHRFGFLLENGLSKHGEAKL